MRAVALLAVLSLSGCVGAALVATSVVGPLLYSGYSIYEFENVENARYDVNRTEPAADALDQIRGARTIALFPANNAVDGLVVDTLRARSQYEIISSRETIAYVERTKLSHDRILSYPQADRDTELRRFGQGVGADLVIFARIAQTETDLNLLLPGASKAVYRINFQIYSGRSGDLLLDERHNAAFDVSDQHSFEDVARLFAYGTADRLTELKTGQTRFAESGA